MKQLTSILLTSILLLASCSTDSETFNTDLYLAIEVVDAEGNDLLGKSSSLIQEGETKVKIGGQDCYLNSQVSDRYTFRHILSDIHSYIKIGTWWGDRTDTKVTIEWGSNIEKDVIVFSYDSPLNGMESPDHDMNRPYSITINDQELEYNEEREHFIYVKDINL